MVSQTELRKIALRYGVIIVGITIFFLVVNYFIQYFLYLYIFTSSLMVLAIIGLLVKAFNEFSRKNEGYISFKQVLCLGGMTLSISFIVQYIHSVIIGFDYLSFNMLSLLFLSIFMLNLLYLIVAFTVKARWQVFEKGGEAGWKSLIPIYSLIVLLKILDKPIWWFVFLLIPGVNLLFVIFINDVLAEKFEKQWYYAFGLTFLPFIFFPILGFSKQRSIN